MKYGATNDSPVSPTRVVYAKYRVFLIRLTQQLHAFREHRLLGFHPQWQANDLQVNIHVEKYDKDHLSS